MNLDNRGWLSLDLFAATLIVILVIISMVAITGVRMDTVNSFQEIARAKMLTEDIAGLVESVYSNGDGYETIYTMPSTIGNQPYVVAVNETGIYTTINGKMGYAHIAPMKISYDTYYGISQVNLRPSKSYSITNFKDRSKNTHIVIKQI